MSDDPHSEPFLQIQIENGSNHQLGQSNVAGGDEDEDEEENDDSVANQIRHDSKCFISQHSFRKQPPSVRLGWGVPPISQKVAPPHDHPTITPRSPH